MKKKDNRAPVYLETTQPVRTKCRTCKRDVLSGLIKGEQVRLDPARITLAAEAEALIAGINTYSLLVLGRATPFRRRVYHIQEGLPLYGYIHAEHRCEKHWATEQIEKGEIFARTESDEPPF